MCTSGWQIAAGMIAMLLSGCDPAALCNGPECEGFYPRGRLTLLHPGEVGGSQGAWSDALAQYDGSSTDGNAWVTSPTRDGVVVGMPGSAQVIALQWAENSLVATHQWLDRSSATGFGTSVLAQNATDGTNVFDLWVGAPQYEDETGLARGAVLRFRPDNTKSSHEIVSADLVLLGTNEGDRFGAEITTCTDLTGDKIPEILVWAPWFLQPGDGSGPVPALAGAIYVLPSERMAVLSGVVDAWDEAVVWWGDLPGEGAGTAVTCTDLEDDGVEDVLIGSPWADDSRGLLTVISDLEGEGMPPSGPLSARAGTRLGGSKSEEWFGAALSVLSYGTESLVAVGSPGFDEGIGRVSVFEGIALETSPLPSEILLLDTDIERFATFGPLPPKDNAHFGRWLYNGDVDGDNLGDLIVGAPDYQGSESRDYDTGRLWAWFATNRDDPVKKWTFTGFTPEADLVIRGEQPFERIGRAVSLSDITPDDEDNAMSLWIPTSY